MSEPAMGELLERFETALRADKLHMLYQPKIRLADGQLAQVEALIRWDDPELGMVDPSRFVSLAEAHGLIGDLTQFGLRTALRQWVQWEGEGIDTAIGFNISALSLEQLDFPDYVEGMCKGLGVPTERLVVELTEGATQPLIKLMDTLTRFRIKGIGLAIDDFGTGYSSMMQLRQLPFTEVKIDRMFISDSTHSPDCRLIVKTIVDLAHGLGLVATGEGIETPEQLILLREIGCDLAQGYLIAPALEPFALAGWKKQFAKRWPALIGDPAPLGRDVEPDALSQR